MSDDSLHSVALKFTAEMGGFKVELKKLTATFFDRLAREILGGCEEVFGRADLNRILVRIESFVESVVDEIVDRAIVTALKHIQLLSGEVKNVRKLDESAEELLKAVRDPAEHYRMKQRIRELEEAVASLNSTLKEYEARVKDFLIKDEKYRVLLALEEIREGGYSELVEKLGFSKTKVAKYVKELEDAGLIEVERSKSPYVIRVKVLPWRVSS